MPWREERREPMADEAQEALGVMAQRGNRHHHVLLQDPYHGLDRRAWHCLAKTMPATVLGAVQ
jgi:hypothetical protein